MFCSCTVHVGLSIWISWTCQEGWRFGLYPSSLHGSGQNTISMHICDYSSLDVTLLFLKLQMTFVNSWNNLVLFYRLYLKTLYKICFTAFSFRWNWILKSTLVLLNKFLYLPMGFFGLMIFWRHFFKKSFKP